VCAALVYWASRRIEQYEASKPGSAAMFCGVVPLGYALLLLAVAKLWPVVLGVGIWMVRRPELARQGRLTLVWTSTFTLVPMWLWALMMLTR
jgi:hypothetical protein